MPLMADVVVAVVTAIALCGNFHGRFRYMNPVWEHWEQDSIGGKGEKVDAYMCVRRRLLLPPLTRFQKVLPRCAAAARGCSG